MRIAGINPVEQDGRAARTPRGPEVCSAQSDCGMVDLFQVATESSEATTDMDSERYNYFLD